ncbi:MAG: dihydroneopterin aldolase [Verrucomicrobiales bacterium]
MRDEVRVRGLELWCRIGVPEEERAEPQRLRVHLTVEPEAGFPQEDDFSQAVDYAAMVEAVKELAEKSEFLLVETLVREIAGLLLRDFAISRVRVELEKFILPETEWVGVALERTR